MTDSNLLVSVVAIVAIASLVFMFTNTTSSVDVSEAGVGVGAAVEVLETEGGGGHPSAKGGGGHPSAPEVLPSRSAEALAAAEVEEPESIIPEPVSPSGGKVVKTGTSTYKVLVGRDAGKTINTKTTGVEVVESLNHDKYRSSRILRSQYK